MAKIDLFENFEKNLSFEVTENIYRAFQECSSDMNPLHTDEDFAKGKGFENCVMYGNILNAFISYAIGMELPTPDVMLQLQDIQYKKPVYLNSKLIMNLKTEELHEAVHVVIFAYKFTNEKGKIVAKGHIQIGVFE